MSMQTLTSPPGTWLHRLLREASGRDGADNRRCLVETYVSTRQGEPELGYLGRTWITRGADYWIRRIGITFVYFLIALFMGALFLGLGPDLLFGRAYGFNRHLPLALKIVMLVVWYAPGVVAYLAMYRRLVLYGFARGRLRRGRPTGFLAGPLLVPLVIPFLSIAGGLVVAMFTATLRADFPGESAAREARLCRLESRRTQAVSRRKPGRRGSRAR